MHDRNWEDLRYILTVYRARSFARAARILHVSESTVSRRIAQAENRLAARLFERSTSKLAATEAGIRLAQEAEKAERHLEAALTAVTGRNLDAGGVVRLTTVPVMADFIIGRILPDFAAAFPEITLELIADPRDFSLNRRETDLALRMARPRQDSRAVARKLCDIRHGVFARRDLDPAALRWIGYDDSMADRPQAHWLATVTSGLPEKERPRLKVSDTNTLLRALSSGLGKSLLPRAIGNDQPELVELTGHGQLPVREIWMMVHPDLRDLRRIRIVMDWLIGKLPALLTEAPGAASDQNSRDSNASENP